MFPSSFAYKGPAEELRSARTFTGGQVLQHIELFGAKKKKNLHDLIKKLLITRLSTLTKVLQMLLK